MTKQLASINEENLKLGEKKKFQIVLVGYDRNKDGNEGYVKGSSMTWPAIRIADKGSVEKLTSLGETGFIPNLVLLNTAGEMVSNDRDEVLKKLTELSKS